MVGYTGTTVGAAKGLQAHNRESQRMLAHLNDGAVRSRAPHSEQLQKQRFMHGTCRNAAGRGGDPGLISCRLSTSLHMHNDPGTAGLGLVHTFVEEVSLRHGALGT